MPLPKFLSNIFGGGASEIISTADKLIDNLTLSKEEKEVFKAEFFKASNEHIEKMAGMAQSEMESYLKDVADARSSNVQIQNSQTSSWLSKNVAYCLDIFVLLIWGTMTVYIVCKFLNIIKSQQGVDFSGVLGLYAGVTALATQIIGFHRGSSKGSEDKSKQIDSMINK
jgi:hypothetical protein